VTCWTWLDDLGIDAAQKDPRSTSQLPVFKHASPKQVVSEKGIDLLLPRKRPSRPCLQTSVFGARCEGVGNHVLETSEDESSIVQGPALSQSSQVRLSPGFA